MVPDSTPALVDRLARFERVVEVGIGNRTDVAAGLAERGVAVTATDVHDRPVPDGVSFVCDDVTDPDPSVYEDADAVYALNCPPELQRAVAAVAREAGAACFLTTLGGDPAAVPATPEPIPGDTLFVVDTDAPGGGRRGGPGSGRTR
ncbi:UPF0146 family protein [Haloarchaeobius litoreus]|uniref:UPF0146 protein ACFSBL_00805 n=1 Tax=Haloarchaeobius litoreus TaxID=755306 RepID=A0ABD6DDZ4_9EURY